MQRQVTETGERSLTRANVVEEPLPVENPDNGSINGGVTDHQAPIISGNQNLSPSMHEPDVLEEENPDLMEGIKRTAYMEQENNHGFNAGNFVNMPIEYINNMVSNLKHTDIETIDGSGMCGGSREGTKALRAKVPKWNRINRDHMGSKDIEKTSGIMGKKHGHESEDEGNNKRPKIQIKNPKSTTMEGVDQPRQAQ